MTNDSSFKYQWRMKPYAQKSKTDSEKCHDIKIHYMYKARNILLVKIANQRKNEINYHSTLL